VTFLIRAASVPVVDKAFLIGQVTVLAWGRGEVVFRAMVPIRGKTIPTRITGALVRGSGNLVLLVAVFTRPVALLVSEAMILVSELTKRSVE
jgi:hypothetical protein